MNRTTLKQLRAFVEVATLNSFRHASERLHVSQPALTVTIQQLEDALGLPLFDRTTRTVNLTEEGRRFLSVAQRLLADFDAAIADVQLAAHGQRGHIVLSITGSVFSAFLEPTLRRFMVEHPAVTLVVRDGGARGPQHRVSTGEADFAVSNLLEHDPGLDATLLLQDQFGVLCMPDNPLLKRRRKLTWRDLQDQRYVGMATEVGVGIVLRKHDLLPPFIHDPHYEASNPTLLYTMMRACQGISVLPALTAQLPPLNEFSFRPLHDPVVTRQAYLITRKDHTLSPAAQTLVDMMLSDMRQGNPSAYVAMAS